MAEEQIEIKEPKNFISWSEYSQFKSCEHKFYISYKLDYRMPTNLTMWSGNIIHSILENIAHKINNYSFKEEFEISWKANTERLTEDQLADFSKYRDELYNRFETIVANLRFSERFNDYDVLHTELKIFEQLTNIEGIDFFYKGYVDMILYDKVTDEYLIVDWKTSGKLWDLRKKLADKDFIGQILIYRHFVAQVLKVPITKVKCMYVALCDNGTIQELPVFPDEKMTQQYLDDIKQAVADMKILNPAKLKKQRFGPKKILCDWCAFNNTTLCNALKNQIPTKPIKK